MLSELLSPLKGAKAPFASVALDASRLSQATGDDPVERWEPQARHLRARGTPEAVIEALGDRAAAETGLGGEHTRVVVASAASIVLDLVLPGRPPRDESLYGPVPHLMPVARGVAAAFPYALVRLDRTGADVERVGLQGIPTRQEVVEGEHDVLHKVSTGGWSQRRYQERVDDSVARNTTAVAERLAHLVRTERPELVLVMGEDETVAELRARADAELEERLVVLASGGRAAGTDPDAERRAIDAALQEHRDATRRELLDRFAEQRNRQQRAVEGLGPVVEALRRGQVDRLLLEDDPTSTVRLWAGDEPLQLGLTESDTREAGASSPAQVRADAALVWALVGSDAEITLVSHDDVALHEGIGALLRWSDPATQHLDVPSMPGHAEPPGSSANTE